jgi:hypothetical protein
LELLCVTYPLLLTILAVHGFAAFEQEGVVVVPPDANERFFPSGTVTAGEIRVPGAEKVTTIVVVKNAKSPRLAGILRPLLSAAAAIESMPDRNALVVVDRAANVRRMVTIIRELDKLPVIKSEKRSAIAAGWNWMAGATRRPALCFYSIGVNTTGARSISVKSPIIRMIWWGTQRSIGGAPSSRLMVNLAKTWWLRSILAHARMSRTSLGGLPDGGFFAKARNSLASCGDRSGRRRTKYRLCRIAIFGIVRASWTMWACPQASPAMPGAVAASDGSAIMRYRAAQSWR